MHQGCRKPRTSQTEDPCIQFKFDKYSNQVRLHTEIRFWQLCSAVRLDKDRTGEMRETVRTGWKNNWVTLKSFFFFFIAVISFCCAVHGLTVPSVYVRRLRGLVVLFFFFFFLLASAVYLLYLGFFCFVFRICGKFIQQGFVKAKEQLSEKDVSQRNDQ